MPPNPPVSVLPKRRNAELRRRQIDDAGTGAPDHAALRGPLQREFHELERLQIQIRQHDHPATARRTGHEAQPQLPILRIALLRTRAAVEFRDRQQPHFERFQRAVNVNVQIRRQRDG